jgi:DNA polymerase
MMPVIAHLDFETRGVLALRDVGVHNYARHHHTDIWCAAYALGEEEEPTVLSSLALSDPRATDGRLANHVANGGMVVAHNAPFELAIWNEILHRRHKWPALDPRQTYCTMAMSYAMGLPGALEDAALAVGLSVLKDTEGRALMLRMARPRKMEGGTPVWWDDEKRIARLHAYCAQDVRVERALFRRLRPLSAHERKVWLMDYAINQRGIKVDVDSAKAGIALADRLKAEANAQIAKLAGGAVETVDAVGAIKDWCAEQGFPIDSINKESVKEHLAADAPATVKQVLLLRQENGKASVAKLKPLVYLAGADNRIRNVFSYHGANTGRWAGRGVQPHNFPRDVPAAGVVEEILAHVRAGSADAIELIYGPPMDMISKCLRGFFVAEGDKVLCAGDFANVEGRGTAWFAGEQWKLDAFRAADAGTGPGLYELSYARAFGIPVEKVKNPSPERQKGKVMELAFGYQGALGAWRKFDQTVPDAEVEKLKEAWRNTHPMTAGTLVESERTGNWYRSGGIWRTLQRAAIAAVEHTGETHVAGAPGRQVKFKVVGSFLWCLLPSGRALCYPYPKILPGAYGDQLTYMTVPGQDKSSVIADPANTGGWARVGTYGGSLLENIIQALCRDLLVHCMLQMQDFVVLHVHDEIVIEVPEAQAERARERMQQVMRLPPEWAKGFPLWAECKVMRRYGK